MNGDDEATAEVDETFLHRTVPKRAAPFCRTVRGKLELAKYSRWQSPYYWAGFVIQGQYEQTEQFSQPSIGKTQIAALAFCVGSLLLALILVLRRRRHARNNV